MAKRYSSKEIIKTLEHCGFSFVSRKGSHIKFKDVSGSLTVIVPADRREIPVGTLRSILRQARLDEKDLER